MNESVKKLWFRIWAVKNLTKCLTDDKTQTVGMVCIGVLG